MATQAYDPNVPWANPATGKLIRQAMNMAINREEMLQHVLKGDGELMYNTAYHPVLGNGYNPQWESDWEALYGYDPDKAKELMAQAGYTPDNPMPFTSYNYFSADEPETAVMLEALINYWEPIGIDVTCWTASGARCGRNTGPRASSSRRAAGATSSRCAP